MEITPKTSATQHPTRAEIIDCLYEHSAGTIIIAEAVNGVFPVRAYHRRARGALLKATHMCVGTLGDVVNASGNLKRTPTNVVDCPVLSLDDVGTKAKTPKLKPTLAVETHTANFSYTYKLSRPATPDEHAVIMASLISAGYCDENCGEADRLYRLPDSQPEGKAMATLSAWNPSIEYDPATFLADMDVAEVAVTSAAREVDLIPAPAGQIVEDEVLEWLDSTPEPDGWHKITCPWAHEHSDDRDVAKYNPATELDVKRVFYCHHTHDKTTRDFLDWVEEQGGPVADVVIKFPLDWDGLAENIGATPETAGTFPDPSVAHPSEPPKAGVDDGRGIYAQIADRITANASHLPNVKLVGNPPRPSAAQIATPANIEACVGFAGATRMFNVMSQNYEWHFDERLGDLLGDKDETMQEGAIKQVAAGCDIAPTAAEGGLANMAATRYHPMEDWMKSLPAWDGVDRLTALADAILRCGSILLLPRQRID